MVVLRGGGGVRLSEATDYERAFNESYPPSEVFSGEKSSDTEMVMKLLKARGYNCVRVMFNGEFPYSGNQGEEVWHKSWRFNSAWLERNIALAKHYGLWLIVDYHGYHEPFRNQDEWLVFWRDEVIKPYGATYDKLVYEPCNEPVTTEGHTEAEALELNRLAYQRFVNMCRAENDNHWIIHSAPCWDIWKFPSIHDPLNKMLGNAHFYYSYTWFSESWTVEKAEAYADQTLGAILASMRANSHLKGFVSTEVGCITGNAPDLIHSDSCGYSTISLAHAKRIIEGLHKANEGYCFWTVGNWCEQSEGMGGVLNTWGNQMPYPPKISVNSSFLLVLSISVMVLLIVWMKGGES